VSSALAVFSVALEQRRNKTKDIQAMIQ